MIAPTLEELSPGGEDAEVRAIDNVPEGVRRAAHAALRRQEPGVPVADIAHDSLLDGDGPRLAERRLRFVSGDRAVVVSVETNDGGFTWHVAVQPSGNYRLSVRVDGGSDRDIETDGSGRALVRQAPRGVVSILVAQPDGEALLRTAWLAL